MDQYRAAFLVGPRRIVMGSLPLPTLMPGEVLVRVRRANLCPTDLKKFYHLDEKSSDLLQSHQGVVLGHEAAGVVEAIGPNVNELCIGDRVAIDPMLPCGRCAYCQSGDFPMCQNLRGIGVSAGSMQDSLDLLNEGIGGAFADYVKVPAHNLFTLPDGISFEAGAMMEPLADVLHSLEVGTPQPDETVVVFGLGAMGLMHVKVMHAWGIERIVGIDPLPERRSKALEFGAYQTIDPQTTDPVIFLKEITGGLGPEVIFICAGGSAQVLCTRQSLQSIRKKGRVLLYASALKPADLSIDINHIHYGMIKLTGTVGFYRRHAEQALRLLGAGSIEVGQIRTPSLPLDQLPEAFQLNDRSEVIKVGIDISNEE
jgi:L-iditol 2-dehydrogenase